MGERRVRGAPAARARSPRSRDRVVAHQGQPPAAGRRAASRRRSRRGANAKPSAPTCRRASCSPTSRSRASCSARRARAKTSRRCAVSTGGTCATAPPTRSSPRSKPGSRCRATSSASGDGSDRRTRAAVTVIGAWITQRAAELDLEPSLQHADLRALIGTGEGGSRPAGAASRSVSRSGAALGRGAPSSSTGRASHRPRT